MKDVTNEINHILQITDVYDAPDKLLSILQERSAREKIFKKMLKLFNNRLDFDCFSDYFQKAFADQKGGQVLTPPHMTDLMATFLSLEVGDGVIKDPCSGTGTLTIGEWNQAKKKKGFNPPPSLLPL